MLLRLANSLNGDSLQRNEGDEDCGGRGDDDDAQIYRSTV